MKISAIILAAGKGTRMGKSEGSEIPKVMFPLCDKAIIDYSIKNIKEAGIDDITLIVGYKKEMIEDYLKNQVSYAIQEEQLGTGHAVACAKSQLANKSDAVLVCYGDMPLYKPQTIKKLIEKFEAEQPTIAMLSVNFEDPIYWVYGRIIRNKEGNVEAIIEQKDCNDEQIKLKECNPGFYIFDSSWLWENIDKLSTNNAQGEYYLTDLVEMARNQGKKVVAMPVSNEWEALGINTQEQRQQAEEILFKN